MIKVIKKGLMPLRKLHGKLHEWVLERKQLRKLCRQIKKAGKHGVLMIATPLHTNLGDSAIVLAEMDFLRRHIPNPDNLIEITSREFILHEKRIARCIHPDSLICWHGGGNMGDQWFHEEKFRRQVLEHCSNKVLIFPQTIFYTPTERGQREKVASVLIYNGRKNITIAAREQVSYDTMKALYPDTEILLVPDIVLSANKDMFGVKGRERNGVLLCLRNDAERAISTEQSRQITVLLQGLNMDISSTDTHSTGWLTKETRHSEVRAKLEEFAGAELVFTDRLHGMVFAAITGTPCVVMGNYNHKVRGTYEWIQYLPYIRFVETVEEAKKVLPELISLKDCSYDNSSLQPYFEELAEVIKHYAQS